MLAFLRPFALLAFGGLHLVAADDQSSGKEVMVKETVLDSSVTEIVYLGKKHECVLVTTKKKKLYFSEDEGQSWTFISDKVDSGDVQVDRIIVNPADKTVAVLQATRRATLGAKKRVPYVYITEDSGKTFRRAWKDALPTGFQMDLGRGLHNWMWHPVQRTWALVSWWGGDCETKDATDKSEKSPCRHNLMFSRDMGKTFVPITGYVVQFAWGSQASGQQNRVYYTAFKTQTGDQGRLNLWTKEVDFMYADISTRGRPGSPTVGVKHGNKFLVSNEYIMVARVKDTTAQTVNLMVSSDGAKSFSPALLPSGMGEIEERWYTILDTSEGAIILHIDSATDGSKDTGRVFISDATGTRYSQSLVDNVRGSSGDCEFDKVTSLNGIYLANIVVPQDQAKALNMKEGAEDEAEEFEAAAGQGDAIKKRGVKKAGKQERTVRTVISYDKGGAWSYLKPPRVDSKGKTFDCDNKPLEECQLNLHGTSSWGIFAPFYSMESAVGIIMATGNVGNSLRFEPDQVNTFLSRDGGNTWIESHKGAYIYEFGDHGGLLVMADDIKETNQVVFSWNEGGSWYDFTVSNEKFEIDNIITEPNVTATTFVTYGSRASGEGVLYFMKFDALKFAQCKGEWAADSVSSDYETWSPSDGISSEKCLLGQKVTYTRRKATSQCWNGMEFERPVVKASCACTQEDFECDLGFTRAVGSTECTYDSDLMPKHLTVGQCDSIMGSLTIDAYRKVPGDQCNGGWQPMKTTVPCPRAGLGVKKHHVGGILVLCLLAYLVYAGYLPAFMNGALGMVGGVFGMFTGRKQSNPFEFGVDTSDSVTLKESIMSFPKKVLSMFSGPSQGFDDHRNVSYGKVGDDDNSYEFGDTPNAPETIGELNDFVESSDDRGAFDSEQDERRAEQDRERDNRTKMLSGGLEVAKASVPALAAPGAVPAAGGAGGQGTFWQNQSLGIGAGDEDLL